MMFIFFILSGKPKITYFKVITGANQQIFGLDISVNDIKTVKVSESFDELVNDLANEVGMKPILGVF